MSKEETIKKMREVGDTCYLKGAVRVLIGGILVRLAMHCTQSGGDLCGRGYALHELADYNEGLPNEFEE